MADALDIRHANKILIFLLERGEIKKTDLLEVVSSSDSLSKSLRDLEEAGLIVSDVLSIGRKVITLRLTPKGEEVARGLLLVKEVIISESPELNQALAKLHEKDVKEWRRRFNHATKGLSMLYHVNVMEDHVTIGEKTATGERVINIYVRVNGHGILRLWCEEDESFECVHVQYAWTLPDVQEMYFNQVKTGNVRK